jgi:hypothetical protein
MFQPLPVELSLVLLSPWLGYDSATYLYFGFITTLLYTII